MGLGGLGGVWGQEGSVIRSNPEGFGGFGFPAYGYCLSAAAGGLKLDQKDLIDCRVILMDDFRLNCPETISFTSV